MPSPYEIGQVVRWWLGEAVIERIEEEDGAGGEKTTYYHVRERNFHLRSRATGQILDAAKAADPSRPLFHVRAPDIVVVDLFQITSHADPLVWHSDLQSYAAAIYLTPDAPAGAGTSFWRDVRHGCRRSPFHTLESERWRTDAQRAAAQDEIYSGYNLVHPDHWELVDKVGAVFNRLVLWDAQLIHSASSYEWFAGGKGDEAAASRLVQLFFFDVGG